MLNDHERKTLREVERQCMAEDPGFTRGFEARQARLSRHPHRLGVGLGPGVMVVAGVLLAVFLLIIGLLGSAVVVAAMTGLIIWAVRHHWVGPTRPTP